MYKKFTKSWMKHVDFILLDLICLHLAYFFAGVLWHGTSKVYTGELYMQMVYVITITSICVAFLSDNHKNILRRGWLKEIKFVLLQSILVAVCSSTYLFFIKTAEQYSRMHMVLFAVLYMIFMFFERNIWKKVLANTRLGLQSARAVLLITSSDLASQMLDKIQERGPVKIVGFGLSDKNTSLKEIEHIPVVALGEEQILAYLQNEWVDEVLIQNSEQYPISMNLVEKCEIMGITVHRCLDFEAAEGTVQIVERFCGHSVLTTCIKSATVLQMFCKRSLDIMGGLVGLLITGILLLIVGPMIYIASPGPIFFSQIRVGCGGRKFKIYKFRSMYMDAEARKQELMKKNQMQGFMFKMDADPRIIGSGPDGTKKGLGWFIRKTSIDEFPQFLNVLKGDMSLVGTRPPTVDEWEKYDYHHRSRLAIKPGITGLWQVSGRSDIVDFEEVVRLDLQYIRSWSITEDIKILVKTVLVVLKGTGSK